MGGGWARTTGAEKGARSPPPGSAPTTARGARFSPHPHAGPAEPISPGLLFARGRERRGRVTSVEGEGNKK